MENLQDALLLDAVQAWCDECQGERILVPAPDETGAGGYCCTVCDAAVFVMWTMGDFDSATSVSLSA
jgi:hypothetical protein